MKKLLFISVLLVAFACSKEDEAVNSTKEFQPGVYGTQEWTIVNASHTTYRDGTPIPQVSNKPEWYKLKTGAWCYMDNDPSKEKLYNWYAFMGIHDRDANTPNKEFAPEGYHRPTWDEWQTFFEFLTENGFDNMLKQGKAIASNSGWEFFEYGGVGNDQETNNITGFNALPVGLRNNSWDHIYAADFQGAGRETKFWQLWEEDSEAAEVRGVINHPYFFISLNYNGGLSSAYSNVESWGMSVRFIKD